MAGFFRKGGDGSTPIEMTDSLRECIRLVGEAEGVMRGSLGRGIAEGACGGRSPVRELLDDLAELDGEMERLAAESDRLITESGLSSLARTEDMTADDLVALGQCIDALRAQGAEISARYGELGRRYAALLRAALNAYEKGMAARVEAGRTESRNLLNKAYGMLG